MTTKLGDPEKVDWFARWMKGILYEKEPEKGGWEAVNLLWLNGKLAEEAGELAQALIEGHSIYGEEEYSSTDTVRAIIRHAADVANLAFMIADNMRIYIEDGSEFYMAEFDPNEYDKYREEGDI